ncbi:hypothetical protein C2G38_2191380 [Gigaspora rosea]|uniref:Uncharacterized protein n=1 Tax=Gigaspora rosea TaxID=44941 RepID=A0A397V9F1_9GLOM|nr:hypothetical protein C2G38_2191380 [Gigaspora rosea]
MPCYAEMIVRVKYIKQNVKEDNNLLVVWALGIYPVKWEDYNIEMTLFAQINSEDRDPESQAVFMTVSASAYLMILNKVTESNKCPLKQLEIIKNEFYVYARDINCIDTQFISKRNVSDHNISKNKNMPSSVLDDHKNSSDLKVTNKEHASKCVHIEDFDDFAEDFVVKEGSSDYLGGIKSSLSDSTCLSKFDYDYVKGESHVQNNVHQKSSSRKGKECADRFLCLI